MTDTQTVPGEAVPAGPLALHDLIAWGETNANCKAFRFEPGVYGKISQARTDSQKELIAKIQLRNRISWGSALMVYATSWGDVQLMGFNLYGPDVDYPGTVIDFLCDIDAQRACFAHFVESNPLTNVTVHDLCVSPGARHDFAIAYNGSPDYMHVIEASLKHFGFSPVMNVAR